LSTDEQKKADNPDTSRTESSSLLGDTALTKEQTENHTAQSTDKKTSHFDKVKDFVSSYRTREFLKDPKTWFEIVALIVVICYTRYAGQQVKSMNQTLGEVRKQTVAIQSQLEVTDRPWLKVSFTAEGRGFYFAGDGSAELSLRAHIQNIGHSVATAVVVPHEMFLLSDANNSIFKEPMEHQTALCGSANNKAVGSPEDQKQQNAMLAMVIFPNDTNESQTIGLVISKSDIDARKSLTPEGPGGKRILPVIVGCIDYEFGTSTRHHQTGFIYEVERRIQVPPNVYPLVMIDITEQVSASDVVLTNYGFGGFVAN